MKSFLVILAIISSSQLILAQEEVSTHSYVLGGSFNFLVQNNTYPLSSLSLNSGIGGIYSNSTNDTKNTTFAITPYIAKDINAHWLLGLQLDYRVGNYIAEDLIRFSQPELYDLERSSNQIGIGLFSRYTLNPTQEFNLYLQPYFEYNSLNEEEFEDTVLTQEEKASFIELGIGLGVLYNVNDRMRATLRMGGLNYINGKWEIVNTDTEKDFSSFGTNLNLATIFFGFEIKM